MSRMVAVMPASSFTLIRPRSSSRSRALASLVVSLGMAMVVVCAIPHHYDAVWHSTFALENGSAAYDFLTIVSSFFF